MKKIGLFLIIIGIFLLLINIIKFIQEKTKIISPLPDEEGVKVIFITPTQ